MPYNCIVYNDIQTFLKKKIVKWTDNGKIKVITVITIQFVTINLFLIKQTLS